MATATTSKPSRPKAKGGKTQAKRVARAVDEKTGCREGSLGYAVGRAYLGETKHESAVEAVQDVLKASAKSKGKPTTEAYVHSRAISWIGFLLTKFPKLYTELPKNETKKEKE